MKIDNSRAKAWWECPLYYYERYVNNIEPVGKWTSVEFGTRLHQLLEARHKQLAGPDKYPKIPAGTPCEDVSLELEAQLTFAAYEAHYPEEEFEVVGVEEYFEVGLGEKWATRRVSDPNFGYTVQSYNTGEPRHTYIGEFDAIVRMKDSGKLWLFETKTEKRGSKDNLPDSWQQKSQVGLYLWAAEQVYEQPFEGILLNVITRQSPKGQERPGFRRDTLVRTRSQQQEAVRNLTWIADKIEECDRGGFWPANRNKCVSPWGWRCDYFPLHSTEERSEELAQIKFKQAEEYLSGL